MHLLPVHLVEAGTGSPVSVNSAFVLGSVGKTMCSKWKMRFELQ